MVQISKAFQREHNRMMEAQKKRDRIARRKYLKANKRGIPSWIERLEPGEGLGGGFSLITMIGETPHHWARRVEALIAKHSKPLSKKKAKAMGLSLKGHGETNVLNWVKDLTKEILKSAKKYSLGPVDGNMLAGYALGSVLLYWWCRLQKAKAYDPNRPLKIRRYAIEKWMHQLNDLQFMLNDERWDSEIWPGQKWDAPFLKGAKDGKFI